MALEVDILMHRRLPGQKMIRTEKGDHTVMESGLPFAFNSLCCWKSICSSRDDYLTRLKGRWNNDSVLCCPSIVVNIHIASVLLSFGH
jgi:hypothetical protein